MRRARTSAAVVLVAAVTTGSTMTTATADTSDPLPKALEHTSGTTLTGRAAPATSLRGELDQMVRDGAVGVVARADGPRVHWSGAAGVRQRGTHGHASPNERFRVGSITKTMVATVVLQEVQRGRLALDTRIDEVLPGVLPGHGDVTVEQLLSHRSGVPDGLVPMIAAKMHGDTNAAFVAALSEPATAQEFVRAALTQPWSFPSGTDYAYSNTGFVLLGMMLHKVTGQPVGQLLQSRVFAPAGMRSTTFPTRPGLPRNALTEAGRFPEGWMSLAGQDPTQFGSAGAVVSTTRDLNAFTRALVSGRLVSKQLVNRMIVPRSQAGGIDYGLGIYRLVDPCTKPGKPTQYVYGHDGATFGTYAVAFTSPDGRRQISAGWTGRHYTDPTGKQPFDINPWAVAALKKTC